MGWLQRLGERLGESLGERFAREPRIDLRPFAPVPPAGYLVGGAVRDALLGRPFLDIDWLVPDPAAQAREAAAALGGSAFALDEERGHWRVVSGEAGETVRDYIRFAGDLEEDLSARDFTINAMAADSEGRLIDPLGGHRDLRRRLLRMTSKEALERDPVRLLRGVRLVAEFGFRLDPATQEAMREIAAAQQAGRIPLPSWERVREELDRILLTPRAGQGFALLEQLGLLALYLPEVAAGRGVEQGGFHHLDVLDHSLEALARLVQGFPEADLTLRWATLLHDVGKPETKQRGEDGRIRFYGHDRLGAEIAKRLLRRLRQPSARVDRAAALVRYHMLPLPRSDKEARRFVHRRRELLPDLLKLMIADREAARGPLSSEATRRSYRVALSRIVQLLEETPPAAPLLRGDEVMRILGLGEGPKVGEALAFLREAVAVGDVTNREEAVEALQRYARLQGWSDT